MPEGIERLLENTFDRDVHISLDVKKATEIFVLGWMQEATCCDSVISPRHATC
jgi:hypothetical protein